MKICSKCKKSKPLNSFWKDSSRKGKTDHCCKECRQKYGTTYYKSERYKKLNIAKQLRHIEKYPEKLFARKVGHKLKLKDKCERCGVKNNLERHHSNYRKPKEIMTLCRCCHLSLHH